MNSPLVSVVMVTCNVDRFLVEAIESILGQTFVDFEFIILDFGSTDESKVIASNYAASDSRIRLNEIPHCGLAEARNAACSLARGRYIAIMDADDISVANRLMWEVDFLEKHPEIGLLGGATEWIDKTGRSASTNYFPTSHDEIASDLAVRCAFCQPTVLIRREAFKLVGGYRAAFIQTEDYDLWLRIAERFRCANLRQVVLKYRIHPHQVSLRKQREQTLCKLAAQASAVCRRKGLRDPFDTIREITPSVLVELGVSEVKQQANLASDCRNWIRSITAAGEYSAALNAAIDFLRSDLKFIEKWQIADLYLTIAQLYWRKGEFRKGGLAAGRAVITRPLVMGRALRPLLRGLGFERSDVKP
jgi:hypothetical protein